MSDEIEEIEETKVSPEKKPEKKDDFSNDVLSDLKADMEHDKQEYKGALATEEVAEDEQTQDQDQGGEEAINDEPFQVDDKYKRNARNFIDVFDMAEQSDSYVRHYKFED